MLLRALTSHGHTDNGCVHRSMEAVIPCMNRLHMVSSTHTNMLRTLGQALGIMDASPTPAAVTGAVRHLLQQRDARCCAVKHGAGVF